MACTVAPITSSLVSVMLTFPLKAEFVICAIIVNAKVNIMAVKNSFLRILSKFLLAACKFN